MSYHKIAIAPMLVLHLIYTLILFFILFFEDYHFYSFFFWRLSFLSLLRNKRKRRRKNILNSHYITYVKDITNLHFRFLMRLLTKQSTLYTEMIHCNAIVLNK